MNSKSPKKDVVFPGSVLCTEEEFEAGTNAYTLQTGDVVSSVVGSADLDSTQHTASVFPAGRSIIPLSRGALIRGKVVMVKDNVAVIEIHSAKKEDSQCAIPNSTAAVPVSQIERGFAKSAKDYFKIGDLVAAEVTKVSAYGIDLATQQPELGVVKAFCDKCRKAVPMVGEEIRCTNCGFALHRKVSSEYWLK